MVLGMGEAGRCGSSTGYSEHFRAGTEPCDPCRAARAEHQAGYVKRRILNGGRVLLVDPTGTRRRIQALGWMGWPMGEIGKRLGVSATQIRYLTLRDRIYPQSAEKIRALYEELCMTHGPSVRARNHARTCGHAPPLAWLDIDDPLEVSLTQLERDHAEAKVLHKAWRDRRNNARRRHVQRVHDVIP